MEVFPNEITIIVLSQFASLNEVVKCYNVCVRWQQIIENIYKNRGKGNTQNRNYLQNNLFMFTTELFFGNR